MAGNDGWSPASEVLSALDKSTREQLKKQLEAEFNTFVQERFGRPEEIFSNPFSMNHELAAQVSGDTTKHRIGWLMEMLGMGMGGYPLSPPTGGGNSLQDLNRLKNTIKHGSMSSR